MSQISVSLHNVPGTEAAVGWAGGHTLVVDRPEGRAGGMGLGFNGGQMLALAIGGCLCNDLRYVAHEMGVYLADIDVSVILELDGSPTLVTSASVQVRIDAPGREADVAEIVRRAEAGSTVSNSIARGLPVMVRIA